MAPKSQKNLLHFEIQIDVLMLCRKFELIPSSNFRVMTIFKNQPISENFPVLLPMLFSKKWLRNHPKFLLHFQIHIDVLMLCRKFELIPSSNFRVMTIFKNQPISENFPVLLPMLLSKKWLRNHPKFLLHFMIHIDVLMLCRKFEPIPSSNF